MEQDENSTLDRSDIAEDLFQIKQYLQKDMATLRKEIFAKDNKIKLLKEELENTHHLVEGNRQLINKLLGELSKIQNNIEWYKRTYEQRSFFGMMRQKLMRKNK